MTQPFNARRITPAQTMLYAAVPACISVLAGGRAIDTVMGGGLANPQSYLLLVRLRHFLVDTTQGHVVPRDGSGLGTVVGWPHLVDSLLCLLALPLRLFLPQADAVHLAAALFGPLTLAAGGIAIAWAIAPVTDRRWLWLAPWGLGLSQMMLAQGIPGAVNPQGMCLIVAIMTAGWALRICVGLAGCGGGSRLGAWAGLGLWLGPQTLLTSALALGAVWLCWIGEGIGRRRAFAIRNAGRVLAVVVMLAWLADPAHGGYLAEDPTRLSVVFVTLSIAIASAGTIVLLVDEITDRPAWRLAISGGAVVVVMTIWGALFPVVLPELQDLIGGGTGWTTPQWPGIAATMIAAAIAWRHGRPMLWYLGLCSGVLAAMGMSYPHMALYPQVLSAAMLPVALTMLARQPRPWSAPAMRIALVGAVLGLPALAALPGLAPPAQAAPASGCDLSRGVRLLEGHGPQVVLTQDDDAPEVLYRTRMLTVGSLSYRNDASRARLVGAWTARTADAPPGAFGTAGISLVLFCPQAARTVAAAPDTVLDRLARHDPPAWLIPVGYDAESGYTLYRVRR